MIVRKEFRMRLAQPPYDRKVPACNVTFPPDGSA